MHTQRVNPILQGVADMRDWILRTIPVTDSMVGYDLFLKIGQTYFGGEEIDLDRIATGLPYPKSRIRKQFERMQRHGLIEPHPGDGSLAPTQLFLEMLGAYRRKFESLFILRKRVRDEQLVNRIADPELSQLAETVYDQFHDLGWMHGHVLGSACLTMSAALARVLQSQGRQARVAWGRVEILHASGRLFHLGAPGLAEPGQIQGHAVCLVDERAIFDFGLGNVRKHFRYSFPWALTTDLRRDGPVFASLQISAKELVTWKDDWQMPDGAALLESCQEHVEKLYARYAEFTR